jgi:DNA-binding NarL/FixJ family response regulator
LGPAEQLVEVPLAADEQEPGLAVGFRADPPEAEWRPARAAPDQRQAVERPIRGDRPTSSSYPSGTQINPPSEFDLAAASVSGGYGKSITERQACVLTLVTDGLRVREIAARLGCHKNSVKRKSRAIRDTVVRNPRLREACAAAC